MAPADTDAVEHIPPKAASTYAKLAAAYGQEYYRSVADAVASHVAAGDRVLDVGTGPGLLPLALAERVPGVRIHGLDLTRALVAYGREAATRRDLGAQVSFFAADCYAIPAGNRTYAFVVSTGVLHSLDDPAAALREIHRVLEPGGRAWVFDPTVLDLPDELDIDLTDRERAVFEAYGVQAGGESPPITEAEARRLVAEGPFEEGEVEVGQPGDVRLYLRRRD